jgi:hypothetical protein
MGMKNFSDVFCHRTDDIFAAVPDVLKIVFSRQSLLGTRNKLCWLCDWG